MNHGQGFKRRGILCWAAPSVPAFRILLGLCLLLSLASPKALAQRGADYDVYAVPPSGPTKGFLGFFDSEQLEPGTWTGELPTFSVDYGITERWSIGTNGLAALGLGVGLQTVLLKSRYLFFSNGQVVSAITGYLGGVLGNLSSGQGLLVGMVTSNTSYWIDPRQSVGLSVVGLLAQGQIGKQGDIDYTSVSATGSLVAGTYRLIPSRMVQIELLLGTPVLAAVDLDATSGAVSLNSGAGLVASGQLLGRLNLDLLVFPNVLLSPQVYFGLDLNDPRSVPLVPMLNIIFRIGSGS